LSIHQAKTTNGCFECSSSSSRQLIEIAAFGSIKLNLQLRHFVYKTAQWLIDD
jgi:hypothetical protein